MISPRSKVKLWVDDTLSLTFGAMLLVLFVFAAATKIAQWVLR